jgi:hypothetical protein
VSVTSRWEHGWAGQRRTYSRSDSCSPVAFIIASKHTLTCHNEASGTRTLAVAAEHTDMLIPLLPLPRAKSRVPPG